MKDRNYVVTYTAEKYKEVNNNIKRCTKKAKENWIGEQCRHSERGKKTRRTEEEEGRQYQGMDRRGVHQVPEGSGEQRKWRKLVAKSSVVPQRPSRLRD